MKLFNIEFDPLYLICIDLKVEVYIYIYIQVVIYTHGIHTNTVITILGVVC